MRQYFLEFKKNKKYKVELISKAKCIGILGHVLSYLQRNNKCNYFDLMRVSKTPPWCYFIVKGNLIVDCCIVNYEMFNQVMDTR